MHPVTRCLQQHRLVGGDSYLLDGRLDYAQTFFTDLIYSDAVVVKLTVVTARDAALMHSAAVFIDILFDLIRHQPT